MPTLISSVSNPRIKDLVRLRERSHRDEAGLLLIEGYRELSRAVLMHHPIHELYYCPALFLGTHERELIVEIERRGAALYELSADPFRKVSYRDRPDGLLATGAPIGHTLDALTLKTPPLVIVAEAIEKPGNLGTMLRTADAVAADAIVVCDGVTDINNPNVVRASTGTIFSVPVAMADGETTLRWVREHGLLLLAATPHADAIYSDLDLTRPIALAVGAEQYGLSERFMNEADLRVRIPMGGMADSLNVATATAVLLFEIARQRGFRHG